MSIRFRSGTVEWYCVTKENIRLFSLHLCWRASFLSSNLITERVDIIKVSGYPRSMSFGVKDSRIAAWRNIFTLRNVIAMLVSLKCNEQIPGSISLLNFLSARLQKTSSSYDHRTSRKINSNWDPVFSCFHCGKLSRARYNTCSLPTRKKLRRTVNYTEIS